MAMEMGMGTLMGVLMAEGFSESITLQKWFKGLPKSKDTHLEIGSMSSQVGQTGGKYDGKPCAKQPGQTTRNIVVMQTKKARAVKIKTKIWC